MNIKNILNRYYWILSEQFGIDPYKFLKSFQGMMRYFKDLYTFRLNYKGRIEYLPCIHDWDADNGSTQNEYFLQDLFVAKEIFLSKPVKHVDIGSRIDGFVAHVASFRKIEIFDIRPISSTIPGVIFKQSDLMKSSKKYNNYCDSISCLHALEHFGLGRYGDPIDINGYERGFVNIVNMLKPGGFFYLSLPVGEERVEFNANRVFNPLTTVKLAKLNKFKIKSFSLITHDKGFIKTDASNKSFRDAASLRYALGVFIFTKLGKK